MLTGTGEGGGGAREGVERGRLQTEGGRERGGTRERWEREEGERGRVGD